MMLSYGNKNEEVDVLLHYTEEEWKGLFASIGALWVHDGNPKRPHAHLTKGGHSDGFFNFDVIAGHPALRKQAAHDLFQRVITPHADIFRGIEGKGRRFRTIGPAMGAVTLADDIAALIPEHFVEVESSCSGYTEKVVDKDGNVLRMKCHRLKPQPGERIVACEDTITSGGSVAMSIAAIEECGVEVLPFVLCIMNRSGLTHVGDREIIAFINQPMHNWTPEECPLCTQGSEALRAKHGDNWARLNASYD